MVDHIQGLSDFAVGCPGTSHCPMATRNPIPNPNPDQGLVGCSMGSQGTMELWDGMDKRDQVCMLDLGLVGCPMGSQGTVGQWDVPKSQWTFYGKAGQLCHITYAGKVGFGEPFLGTDNLKFSSTFLCTCM